MMNATPSLADIAAVTDGNRNNDGFGNGNGWWVLIILFAIFGGWGNGMARKVMREVENLPLTEPEMKGKQ